jgi:hypothetical protein
MSGMNSFEFRKKAKKIKFEFFILTGFEITEANADALNGKIAGNIYGNHLAEGY